MNKEQNSPDYSAATPVQRKPYSEALALRVARIYGDLCEMEEVITISSIARRAGVCRASVRAVLKHEFGWTSAHSEAAHQVGRHRGQLIQSVAGHPGLARGRRTLEAQGWPNLQRGHQTLAATGYAGLGRGRAAQAAEGWPVLHEEHKKRKGEGFPQLARGRRNLALRGWPNWNKAQVRLAEQGYLPLLEARLLSQRRQTRAETDRRLMRGRTTQLAVLEALERATLEQSGDTTTSLRKSTRITGVQLAKQLHLHPETVYKHLKRACAILCEVAVTNS